MKKMKTLLARLWNNAFPPTPADAGAVQNNPGEIETDFQTVQNQKGKITNPKTGKAITIE